MNVHEKAMIYYKKQLQYAWYPRRLRFADRDMKLKTQELDAYDNIGLEYFYMGDIEKAGKYHERAMQDITEEEGSPMKTCSRFSLERRKADIKEWVSLRYCNLREDEKSALYENRVSSMFNKSKKPPEHRPLAELISVPSKIALRDLPTASSTRRQNRSEVPEEARREAQLYYWMHDRFRRMRNVLVIVNRTRTEHQLLASCSTSSLILPQTIRRDVQKMVSTNAIYTHLSQDRRPPCSTKVDRIRAIIKELSGFKMSLCRVCQERVKARGWMAELEQYVAQLHG